MDEIGMDFPSGVIRSNMDNSSCPILISHCFLKYLIICSSLGRSSLLRVGTCNYENVGWIRSGGRRGIAIMFLRSHLRIFSKTMRKSSFLRPSPNSLSVMEPASIHFAAWIYLFELISGSLLPIRHCMSRLELRNYKLDLV